MRRHFSCALCAAVLFAGCTSEDAQVSYTCEEPLEPYLAQARENIANDYEVARSRQVLTLCPDKGFHRRYTFSFSPGAIASKQPSRAVVNAVWCGEPGERSAEAELSQSATTLKFYFKYPWSTPSGKYPRTEFVLNRSTLEGGFYGKSDWSCRLVKKAGSDE